ncbi:MAG: hypothetical protein ACRDRL_01315, partial [Sciscionella sp.]
MASAAALLREVHDLHEHAVAENAAARPIHGERALTRALTVLTQAADAGADEAELAQSRARIMLTLANSEYELYGLGPAITRLTMAMEQIDRQGSAALRFILHAQRGLIRLRAGQVDDALIDFDLALPVLSAAEPADQARLLLNRGTANLARRDALAARTDLHRCIAVTEAAGLSVLEFKARHNLGYLEFLVGDLPLALRLMESAMRVDTGQAWGIPLLDRAAVLGEAGLIGEADAALASAARLFARDRSNQDLAETDLERARCALVVGDTAAARRFAGRARYRFRRRGNEPWRRSAELLVIQADLVAGRPSSRLVAPALRLWEQLTAEGLRLPARAAALTAVEAQLAAGRVTGA